MFSSCILEDGIFCSRYSEYRPLCVPDISGDVSARIFQYERYLPVTKYAPGDIARLYLQFRHAVFKKWSLGYELARGDVSLAVPNVFLINADADLPPSN